MDWSGTNDAIASGRLGRLKALVREKAGSTGRNKNIISCCDIFAALGVSDADDLLPCKSQLIDVKSGR